MPPETLPTKWRPCHACYPPGDDLHDADKLETCIKCKRQYCRLHFRGHSCEEQKAITNKASITCSCCEEPYYDLRECLYCGDEDLCQDCMEPYKHSCRNWDRVLPIDEKELQDADHYYERERDEIHF